MTGTVSAKPYSEAVFRRTLNQEHRKGDSV
jgi:hypothetical protein